MRDDNTNTRKDETMTEKQIQKRQEREAIRYETAKEIRRMLNEAKKKYNSLDGDWDGDDLESDISELVFEEE